MILRFQKKILLDFIVFVVICVFMDCFTAFAMTVKEYKVALILSLREFNLLNSWQSILHFKVAGFFWILYFKSIFVDSMDFIFLWIASGNALAKTVK